MVEYETAYAGVLHYDSFRWSAGSMLIAGVFLFWGVVFTNESTEELFPPASIVVALIMTVWILYASHYRQLYLLKLHRIQEIEATLGLEANRRFKSNNGKKPEYRSIGIRGHDLDVILYVLVATSGSFLAISRQGTRLWQLIPGIIAAIATGVVFYQEARIKTTIRQLPIEPKSGSEPKDRAAE